MKWLLLLLLLDNKLFDYNLTAILRRELILLICLFYLTQAKSQSVVYNDSLSQYSYLLFGSTLLNADNNSTRPIGEQGTGFFVRIDSSVYLITAKHTIVNYLKNNDYKKDFPVVSTYILIILIHSII